MIVKQGLKKQDQAIHCEAEKAVISSLSHSLSLSPFLSIYTITHPPAVMPVSPVGLLELRLSHHTSTPEMNCFNSAMNIWGVTSGCEHTNGRELVECVSWRTSFLAVRMDVSVSTQTREQQSVLSDVVCD